ncbi:MAG: hypothetical protein AAF495_14715 [Pseudomonadota bacterium]
MGLRDQRRPLTRLALCFVLAQACLACSATTYSSYNESDPNALPPHLERRVTYQVTRAFFQVPPDCVLVLPLRGVSDPGLARSVESALSRHIGQKVPRVLGPKARGREKRRLALDLTRTDDQLHLARATECEALLEAKLTRARDDYFLVWSERTLGLEATLVRAEDRTLLWRAKHTGIRAEGGLPISIGSIAVNAALATRFTTDQDIEPSLVDDVVRRLATTLPDVR